MSSFLIMFTATVAGIVLAVPTYGLSMLLPVLAWVAWVKPKDAASSLQATQQRQQREPERRSWFFGGFWW